MNKHAYLIIAHNNFEILERQLKMLDSSYNDIYIHIDKKVKSFDFEYFIYLCKHSSVYFTKKRYNVRWGHQTQVLTEMLLFSSAYKNDKYSYYHLLSGVDLPLKSADEIYHYFDNKAKSYLYVSPVTTVYDLQRISRYRLKLKNEKLLNIFNILQDKFKINRVKNVVVKKGYNWCSLTQNAVAMLLKHKNQIFKMTFLSSCADEVYKQTVLCRYLPDEIYYDKDGNTDDLRYVDWSEKKENPKILELSDFDRIINSLKLFARKFDFEKSQILIDKIYDYVMKN